MKDNGAVLRTGLEKANAIAGTFGNSHTITINNASPFDSRSANYADSIRVLPPNGIIFTDANEVESFVRSLKNNKAPGLDGVNSIILPSENMPSVFFEVLSRIFNCCLVNGNYPSCFKKAKVIPIHKKGKDPKLPSSYRPITLLSLLDKVFEKIIHERGREFAEQNNIINHQQFGFRKEHSTVHHIKACDKSGRR